MESMPSVKYSLSSWFFIMLITLQFVCCRSCLDAERTALLELKAYFKSVCDGDLADYALDSWTDDIKSDCCRWERVKCNDASGRILELALNMSMNFPGCKLLNLSLIHPFKELESLDLSSNYFHGLFDDKQGYKSFMRLKKLQILNLNSNLLNNSIFPFLSAATSLKILDIGRNSLDGIVPLKDLGNLRKLEVLDLSGNGFSSVADPGYKSFTRLKKLEILHLSSNLFNNSIFPFLNAATSLKILDIGFNRLDGIVPVKDLGNLRELKVLDLSDNAFNGSVANPGFSNFTKLKALGLRANQFSEKLQLQGICELKNLRELDLSGNQFTGQIPQCIRNMTRLRALDLSHNAFNGSVADPGICELKNLRELDLSENQFIGQIPQCIRNMTRLRSLNLSYNHLSGQLPSFISDLTSLESLSASENDFEGSFSFSVLANHSKLKEFELSSRVNKLQVTDETSWLPTFQLKALDLQNCNLNGRIPGFLLHQYDLRFVQLSHNNLVETIPFWLLQNNSKLESLIMRNNSLAELQLPENTHGLLHLDVSDNKIGGSVPENIGLIFPKLEYMNLSRNRFYNNFPSSVSEMKSLRNLDVSDNKFSGELPEKVFRFCGSLEYLKLSNNTFQGQIFPDFTSLIKLKRLYVNDNNFTGGIGTGLLNLVSLSVLDMSNNMLSSKIPDWIGSFAQVIRMGRNKLEGEIPVQLLNETNIRILDLSENRLSGSIPSVGIDSNLWALYLRNNGLVGPIPDALFGSTSLRVVDLSNNKLSGSIPKSIGDVSNLYVVLLRGNRLQGHIPDEVCNLRNINFLDFSHNRFHGSVPLCLNNISFGTEQEGFYRDPSELDIGIIYQALKPGPVPKPAYPETPPYPLHAQFEAKRRYESFEGVALNFMYGLDFSSNKLTGQIPTQIGYLQKLRALNLSFNHLSGSIPKSFSNMTDIESLDLSYNRLQGQIPPQLAELNALAVFDVSYNNLSGLVPDKNQFTTFNESSYKGNPNLCGPRINKSCDDNEVPTPAALPLEIDDDGSVIDMGWFYWSFGATYVVVLLGIFVFLCIDTHWSRAWFYRVDICIYHLQQIKHSSCRKNVRNRN